MEYKFEQYLDESNDNIKKILSYNSIGLQGKKDVINEYIDGFIHNNLTGTSFVDVNYSFDKVRLATNDKLICDIIKNSNADSDSIKKAINICHDQKKLFEQFYMNEYFIPANIQYLNVDNCITELESRYKAFYAKERVLDVEKGIGCILDNARKEHDYSLYDDAIVELNSLEKIYAEYKEKKITIPETKYKNTKKVIKQITDEQLEMAWSTLKGYDEKIELLFRDNTEESYKRATELLKEQKKLIDDFFARGWRFPKLKYPDAEKCMSEVEKKLDIIKKTNELVRIDSELDDIIDIAQLEYDEQLCKKAFDLSESFDGKIKSLKHEGIEIPQLKCVNYSKVKKRIDDLSRRIGVRNTLIAEIKNNDNRITELTNNKTTNENNYLEIIRLCEKQNELITKAGNEPQILTTLKNTDFDYLKSKYILYNDIVYLDSEICKAEKSINSKSKYDAYIGKCQQLNILLNDCRRLKYEIPSIVNQNPVDNKLNADKVWKQTLAKHKAIKMLAVIACVLVLFAGAYIFIYFYVRIRFPYSMDTMEHMNYAEINDGLSEYGFSNITCIPDNSGWEAPGTFKGININDSDEIIQGTLVKKNSPIVIIYASQEKTNLREVFYDWKKIPYSELYKKVNNSQLSDIEMVEKPTYNINENDMVIGVSVDGKKYDNQEWYAFNNAKVVIEKYKLYCATGYNNQGFIDKDINIVVEELKNRGFENVNCEYDEKCFGEPGKTISVTIDGKTSYKAEDRLPFDSEITIVASSLDRVDITTTMEDINDIDYSVLLDSIKEMGINSVSTEESVTTDENLSNKVKEVKVNGNVYTSGECIIDKKSEILITYNSLYFQIDKSSDELKEMGIYDLKQLLVETGFDINNIKEIEEDTGIMPTFRIISLSIDGKSEFDKNEKFRTDANIILKITPSGRIDIGKRIKYGEWENISYEKIKNNLETEGFNNIIVSPIKWTDNPNVRHNSIVSVTVNGVSYTEGDCYGKKDTRIEIKYNESYISIGRNSSEFAKQRRGEVIDYLESRGFVYNKKSDVIKDNSWEFYNHGEVIEVVIDGKKNVTKNEYFPNGTEFSLVYWE